VIFRAEDYQFGSVRPVPIAWRTVALGCPQANSYDLAMMLRGFLLILLDALHHLALLLYLLFRVFPLLLGGSLGLALILANTAILSVGSDGGSGQREAKNNQQQKHSKLLHDFSITLRKAAKGSF
jgi:hypothetical protein